MQFEPPDLAIALQNAGASVVDLTGWQLRIGMVAVSLPPGTRVDPSTSVIVYTGDGVGTAHDVYLGQAATSLLGQIQPGAVVSILDPSKVAVATGIVPPASGPTQGAGAAAIRPIVDPRDLVLSPTELPPGFVVNEDATTMEVVMIALADTAPDATLDSPESEAQTRQAGVRYQTELRREQIGDDAGEGRIVIGQTVTRLDAYLSPVDILAESRDVLIREEGFAEIQDLRGDGRAVRLVKHTATDTIFAIGIIKDETVIFTSVRGVEPSVSLETAMGLASRSASKYDLLSAAPPSAADAPGGLAGQVLARPACPGVEREGPACAPAPAAASMTVLSDNGEVVTRFQTGDDGRFAVELPAGHYVLRPELPGAFGAAEDHEFVVSSGKTTQVDVELSSP
jgi:hypothetical protein